MLVNNDLISQKRGHFDLELVFEVSCEVADCSIEEAISIHGVNLHPHLLLLMLFN